MTKAARLGSVRSGSMVSASVLASALVLVLGIAGLASPVSACSDAGAPEGGLPVPLPWDAGPGCHVERADSSCGAGYMAVCEPVDVGPQDAGTDAASCTPYRDTGADGPTGERWTCTSDSDCPSFVPDLHCGGDGYCACSVAPPPRGSSGCAVAPGRARDASWLAVLVAAMSLARQRRPRG